jgi:hypothetical protein
LTAWWDFAEGTGTKAGDSSGNGNVGTLANTSWSTNGCGKCIWLNGTSSNMSVPDKPGIDLTTTMSVSMWVNSDIHSGSDPRLIAKRYSWDVKLNGSNRYPQLSANGKYALLNYSLPTGKWQHLVFTFSSGVLTAYVNGQPVSFLANTFTPGDLLPQQLYGLVVGADADNTTYFNGYLDDIRVYSRVLSAAEVSTMYSQTPHSSSPTSPRTVGGVRAR